MQIGYYPGCSLHSTARPYESSTQAVCKYLGVELVEVPDWNCCGSTPAHVQDHHLSLALSARNLVQAEKAGLQEVTAPCAACFNHLKAANAEFHASPEAARKINDALEENYRGTVSVNNILELMINKIGLETIKKKVVKPLKGLKVVPYYGCLLTRPHKVTQFDHPTNPTSMDELLEALGATVLPWSAKTDCCGAAYSLTYTDVVYKLTGHILDDAAAAGADVIACACPLCMSNLDTRQPAIAKQKGGGLNVPALYITQLMGLSFGLNPGSLGLRQHLVSSRPKLQMRGII